MEKKIKNVQVFVLAVMGLFLFFASPALAGVLCETENQSEDSFDEMSDERIELWKQFIAEISHFIYDDLDLTATKEAMARLSEFHDNMFPPIDYWWSKLGAVKGTGTSVQGATQLQALTGQISAAKIDQTRQIGFFIDAEILNEVLRAKQEQYAKAYERNRINTQSCQMDSVSTTQNAAFQVSRGIAKTIAKQDGKRRGNFAGTTAASGGGAALKAEWDEYSSKFCDTAMGDVGCATSPLPTMPGMQTNIPGFLWDNKQTIDMDNPDNQLTASAMQKVLLAPFADDPLTPDVLSKAEGQEAFMMRRSRDARLNTAYNAVGQMLGERAQAKQNTYNKEIRDTAGVPVDFTSDKPSYSELRETMGRVRFQDPKYFALLAGNPVAIQKEQNIIGAATSQSLNDFYKRYEEMVMMEAARYAAQLDRQLPSRGTKHKSFQ